MDYQVEGQAAYVLHSRPYRDSSAIVDFFTLEHGRVSAVVRGLRRPGSKQRGILQPFVPLQIAWRGRQELKTLSLAESVGFNGLLSGRSLICGLYINELLEKLFPPQDPQPKLYLYYQYALNALIDGVDIEGALRTFERQVVGALGLANPLDELDAQSYYRWSPQGWQRLAAVSPRDPRCFFGAYLLGVGADNYQLDEVRKAAKRLMRLEIERALDGRELRSRALFQSLAASK